MTKLLPAMILAVFLSAGCGSPDRGETSRTTDQRTIGTTEVTETTEVPEITEATARPSEETTGAVSENPQLAAMREGGFVIFIRHTETDASPMSADADGHLNDLSNCSLQRNLTDDGRRDARDLGREIERLEVPVGEVLASPYCRTRQAAELVFGDADLVPELATPRYLAPGDPENEVRLDYLREVFSTPPTKGTNTWVLTHELNLRLASGASVPEGGAVVFEPLGERGFEVFATFAPQWWEEAP